MSETYTHGDYEWTRNYGGWSWRRFDAHRGPFIKQGDRPEVDALLNELHPAPPVKVTLNGKTFERNGGLWESDERAEKCWAIADPWTGIALDRIVELGGADGSGDA